MSAIVQSILGSLSDALASTDANNFNAARDYSIRAEAYLSLISMHSQHGMKMKITTDSNSIECISIAIEQLKSVIDDLQSITSPASTSISSTVAQTSCQFEIEQQKPISQPLANIFGNCAAKTALYEAIILPLTIDKDQQSKLYSGIRKSCSNILLYGPPGCVYVCMSCMSCMSCMYICMNVMYVGVGKLLW